MERFEPVVNNAFAGMGFTPEASLYAFPPTVFPESGNLTPLEENIDKIIDGLTKWQAKITGKRIVKPPRIMIESKDYEEAFTNMNNLFLRNLWSDGLPILPPTEERVSWILTGTDLSRDSLVGTGKILPRGGIADVETLAICLAMAGGRPEYLPVLIAATESITNPVNVHQAWQATTGSFFPMVIVNGPMAKQIRLNRSYSLLAPTPKFPAGASIGRAVRFLLMNVGGAIPGSGTMTSYGGAGRYTGFVFAENEDGLPPEWEPLNVEMGFTRGSNTVTVHAIDLSGDITEGAALSEEGTVSNMKAWAWHMAGSAYMPVYTQFLLPTGAPGYLLITPGTAQQLSKLGWSKNKVKNFLWEHARVPKSEYSTKILEECVLTRRVPKEELQWPMPIARRPENIKIVVAGAPGIGHGYWLRCGQKGAATTARIKLPANWGSLIRQAEEDLGPVPVDEVLERHDSR